MKKLLLRSLMMVACLLGGGCASVVQGLDQLAWQLEQDRLRQEAACWEHAMYAPRRAADTSAPGIR
jgi:hypothetical protein